MKCRRQYSPRGLTLPQPHRFPDGDLSRLTSKYPGGSGFSNIAFDRLQELSEYQVESSLYYKLDCEDNMTLSSSSLAEGNPDAIACRLLQKAHTRDGLPDIAIGIFFLIVAGLNWLNSAFPPRSPINIASTLGLMLAIIAFPFGLQWALKNVRGKLLIQKVGYVKLKPANRKRTAIVLAFAFVLAAATAIAIYAVVAPGTHRGSPLPVSWILAGTGIGGGVLMAVSGRLPRYVIGGLVMAAIGIVLAFSKVSLEVGFTILYGSIGTFALVSGVVVLFCLMRKPAEPPIA